MAIVEISKIQVRRGKQNETNLPVLDAGEFGWATDTQRLFIGNGDPTADGAPYIGNTEIVTAVSFPNFFQAGNIYTYGQYVGELTHQQDGFLIHTGPSNSSADTPRALFSKLDDIVSVADFGVIGDGTPFTEAGFPVYQQLQQAIDQTFNNFTNQTFNNVTNQIAVTNQTAKKLLIPAGTYIITGTLYVPPYATIVGDGPNTVLQATGWWWDTVTGSASTSTNPGASGHAFQYTSTSIIQFVGVDNNGNYRYFGSNTGTNIQSHTQPTQIHLDNLQFSYENTNALYYNCEPLVRADCAIDSQITNCFFKGYSTYHTGTDYYTCLEIRSQGAIDSENLQIRNNVFYNTRNGIVTNYDSIYDTIISDNRFNSHRTAISYFAAPANGQNTGPVRSKFLNNNFVNIDREAIYIGTPTDVSVYTDHVSFGNSFKEVGNNLQGELNQQFAAIQFGSKGNTTTQDKFDRESYVIQHNNDTYNFVAPVKGSISYESGVAYKGGIVGGSVETTLLRVPFSGVDQIIKVQYNISKTTVSRKGELLINVSTGLATGSTATITDSYTFYGDNDGNINFGVSLNQTNNTVKVLYTSLSSIGTLEYKYNYLG